MIRRRKRKPEQNSREGIQECRKEEEGNTGRRGEYRKKGIQECRKEEGNTGRREYRKKGIQEGRKEETRADKSNV